MKAALNEATYALSDLAGQPGGKQQPGNIKDITFKHGGSRGVKTLQGLDSQIDSVFAKKKKIRKGPNTRMSVYAE